MTFFFANQEDKLANCPSYGNFLRYVQILVRLLDVVRGSIGNSYTMGRGEQALESYLNSLFLGESLEVLYQVVLINKFR